ncbi:MAG: RluA family pseudouridine synthase, partial [Oscillospiraceae bacterium]|nr:RluA family pseudouridine synthase [Oscillospiraceae bacterium]
MRSEISPATAEALRYTVPPELAGRSVRAVMLGPLGFSGGLFRSLKWRPGAILCNGFPARADTVLFPGDELRVALQERRAPSPHAAACALPLQTVYEDGYLLVLDKPAGIAMHDKSGPSMAGALRAYLGPEYAAHFVSRLDRGVSGLCLAAKSGYLHDRFREMLHTRALEREYLGLVHGRGVPDGGVIELPIAPAEDGFGRWRVHPDGKPSRTEFSVEARSGPLALLRLRPCTGRSHQLRVHLRAMGWPLAGDTRYGAPEAPGLDRPALHS